MAAQCRQQFLSILALKPAGIRGASRSLVALQAGHGAPGSSATKGLLAFRLLVWMPSRRLSHNLRIVRMSSRE
jgi:hypothetical protein